MVKDFFTPAVRTLGHRGNSQDYPENTEKSFRSAVEAGVDVIETDVRLMKDGTVLISHDDDFCRLSGDKRKIAHMTRESLDSIDAGFMFTKDGGESYPHRNRGIRPLLLEDAFRLFPDVRFNIDLKDKGRGLVRETVRVILNARAVKRVCIGSFHHRSLRLFRQLLPGVATSLSRREMLLILLLYRFGWVPSGVKKGLIQAAQIPEYAGPYRILRPSFYRWCRRNGLALQVWTINDPVRMAELFHEGVDALFSDVPSELVRVSRETQKT